MKVVEFDSRRRANQEREKVDKYLLGSDDRRTTTVKLKDKTPDRFVKRLEDAAFDSKDVSSESAGMQSITDGEKESLKRVHSNWTWQKNGFEAMRAKAALLQLGVTDWKNYYEPGEGTAGALANLERGKQRSAESGAKVALDGRRDGAMHQNKRQRQSQARRMAAAEIESAKAAAIVDGDTSATEFVREEQEYAGSVFDVDLRENDSEIIEARGTDADLLRERNQTRSDRARRMDSRRAAKITTNPLEWAADPSVRDFPGIDTIRPNEVFARKSERSRAKDRQELAPRASSLREWYNNVDSLDWPGVDTPPAMGLGTDVSRWDDVGEAAINRMLGGGAASVPDIPTRGDTPVSELAQLSNTDISLTPDEAFEGAYNESEFAFDSLANDNSDSVPFDDGLDLKKVAQEQAAILSGNGNSNDDREREQPDMIELDPQVGLDGQRTNDQATFAGMQSGEVESEVEKRAQNEYNPGGLFADERDGSKEKKKTKQSVPDAFVTSDGNQQTF